MTRPHDPTDASKVEVKALASMGIRHEDIAEYIGVDKKTLYKYYREILSKAKVTASHKVAQALFKQATEQNSTTAAIFWLKCHAGWKDSTKKTSDDEQTIEDINLEIKKLELEKIRREVNPPKEESIKNDYVVLKPDEDIPNEPIL